MALRNCPSGIISPMRLPSARVARLSKYIEVTGSGYGPCRAEKGGLSCGTMSKRCVYIRKPSVPGAGAQPLRGTMRIMSRIWAAQWPDMNRSECNFKWTRRKNIHLLDHSTANAYQDLCLQARHHTVPKATLPNEGQH